MHVISLTAVDFRSYSFVEINLEPGVTTFIGSNGQGKTNLVEAISYCSTLSSHRVSQDLPLVKSDQPRAIVRTGVKYLDRTNWLEVEIWPSKTNKAKLNGSECKKTKEILGILQTVTFSPEDLILVKGDPGERRHFLDELLVQKSSSYAGIKSDYDRVLKQRNALLKSAGPARKINLESVLATLDVWNDQLVNFGSQIIFARNQIINELLPYVSKSYAELAPTSKALNIKYLPNVSSETMALSDLVTAMKEKLQERQQDELDRGLTLVGPHRDDMEIFIGELPAKGYASHGESWSVALALKLASFDLLKATSPAGDPVLILDDVFAELDAARRNQLILRVKNVEQVLITAAVMEDVPKELVGNKLFVNNGKVETL
ncbi:DNA replication and repair protein RecF [Actinomycetes bacterium]|nr:DNA replication and repair protein RecF [Actinomycetes bacterium]